MAQNVNGNRKPKRLSALRQGARFILDSPYWLWAWFAVLWQTSVYIVHHEKIILTTGVAYRTEDSTFVGFYYFLMMLTLSLCAVAICEFLRRRSIALARTVFAFTQFALGFLLWLDIRIYSTLGLHLTDPIFLDRIQEPKLRQEIDLGAAALREILVRLGLEALVVLSTGTLAFFIWRRRRVIHASIAKVLRTLSYMVPSVIAVVWFVTFFLRGWSAIYILDTLPFFKLFDSNAAVLERNLLYPPHIEDPKLNGKTLVLVGIESFRSTNWNQELMPLTWKFIREHPQCVVRTNHYAPSSVTEAGVFSFIYGVNANMYRYFRKMRMPPFSLAHLKRGRYSIESHVSGDIKHWSSSAFVFANFDSYSEYGAENDEYYARDRMAVANLKTALASGPQNKFVFGFISSTHHNYSFPPEMDFYQPVVPLQYQGLESRMPENEFRNGVKNRYYNSVRFVDTQVSDLLNSVVGRIKKGDIEIVLSGDHGEEFWDHGQQGHASPRFYTHRIRVPLIWCGSLTPPNPDLPSAHVDILPTLFTKAGVDPAHFKQYFSGVDINGPDFATRKFIINVGVFYPERSNQLSIIDRDLRTYWMQDKWTGFELTQITDRNDQSVPLSEENRKKWEALLPEVKKELHRFNP